MGLETGDRVKETSTTTGTGTLDLGGAATGFQTFVAGVGDTNTVHYCIVADNGDWEVGIGTVTDASPDTLSRDYVLDNSLGTTAKINFGSGTKQVFATAAADLIGNLAAQVARTTNFTLSTGSSTDIDFDDSDAVIFDQGGIITHDDAGSEPERIYINDKLVGCVIWVGFYLPFDDNATGARRGLLNHFDSSDVQKQATGLVHQALPGVPLSSEPLAASGLFLIEEGDYFKLNAYQDSGGNLDVFGNANGAFSTRVEFKT